MTQASVLHICSLCNYFGTATERYCPLCGSKLISHCRECDEPIANPFARFCVRCGQNLLGNDRDDDRLAPDTVSGPMDADRERLKYKFD